MHDLIKNCRKKYNRGITLIALVITIIILIILAGISIAGLTGENSIIKKAMTAKDETEKDSIIESVQLDIARAERDNKNGSLDKTQLIEILEKYFNTVPDNLNDDTILIAKDEYGKHEIPFSDLYNGNLEDNVTVTDPITIPEGLEIGTAVSYTPNGTYNWDSKYYTYNDSDTVVLDSSSTDFKLTNWRVLDINKENGEITLVPTTTSAESVKLEGAQGYNNGVFLLNMACNKLYGNESKSIYAKNIDMSILEKYMTSEALTEAHKYEDYGKQRSSSYGSRNNSYPVIYDKEINSVIDEEKKETGLSLNSQTDPITVDKSTSPEGFLTATTNINPYQTYYYGNSDFTETAFKDVENSTLNYYELLIPEDSDTKYWIASRCIQHHSGACEFGINYIREGRIDMVDLFYSDEESNYYACKLFPVVTLNVNNISGDSSSGFRVNV